MNSSPAPEPTDRSMAQCARSLLTHLSNGRDREVAEILANLLARYLSDDSMAKKYFPFWEERGFHLTPVHYYSPIPDTRALTDHLWAIESQLVGIDLNRDFQLHLLSKVFPEFKNEYNDFPHSATGYEFAFDNPNFGGTDALVLYCMLRHFNPSLIIEIGSGWSTRLSSKAALRNGDTNIVCIDPFADDVVAKLPRVSKVISKRVETLDLSFFQQLGDRDVLFIDSSHTVKCGGDVNFLYLEVLPRLKKGVIVHSHDVFFPKEYPKEWVRDLHLFWNEQYLLQAFLTFNSEFELLFCNSYMGMKYLKMMKAVFPKAPWWGGGSCWFRRRR